MNRARVAALLRELADEIDASGDDVPAPPKSKPRRKPARVRVVPSPKFEPAPIDRAAAQKLIRRQGLA